MKTKKEAESKKKVVPKKKVVAKIRTVSSVKKVIKKTKTAVAKKKVVRRIKTIAAPKVLHKKTSNKFSAAKITYRLKRLTYMILSVMLGLLIAGFLSGLLERTYLENNFNMEVLPTAYQFMGIDLFLAPIAYIVIFAAGFGFGTWIGFWGWRMVYIEHRHRMFKK